MASALVGEEIRENFGYLQSNYSLFEDIEKRIDSGNFEYKLIRSGSGLDHVWLKDDDHLHQAPLRELSRGAYDQLSTTLADLSIEIFKDVHQCYRKIDRFNTLRASIAAALAGDAAPIEVLLARGQISMILRDRDLLEGKLQEVHGLLCGSRMEFDFGKVKVVDA